jgi:hypothetical protein
MPPSRAAATRSEQIRVLIVTPWWREVDSNCRSLSKGEGGKVEHAVNASQGKANALTAFGRPSDEMAERADQPTLAGSPRPRAVT